MRRALVLGLVVGQLAALGCTWHRQLPPLSDAELAAYANDEGFPLVRQGMTTEDVIALLGPPTSQDSHPSVLPVPGPRLRHLRTSSDV